MSTQRTTKPHNMELTNAQELFVQCLLRGMSQRQAYMEAYPKSRNWKPNAIDNRACLLAKSAKVSVRYQVLVENQRRVEQAKTGWTRERAIEKALKLMETGEREIDRLEQAYNDELERLKKKIEDAKEDGYFKIAEELEDMIASRKKARRLSMAAGANFKDGLTILNKMHGYDEANINLTMVTPEMEAAKALSTEELKQLVGEIGSAE